MKHFKYVGITLLCMLALIPLGFFAFIGVSYYFDKDQLPKGEFQPAAPLTFYDVNGNPLPIKSESECHYAGPSGHSESVESNVKNKQGCMVAPQDPYYTPFIMPGPPGSNLYYISRPDGGYDQATGPQIK